MAHPVGILHGVARDFPHEVAVAVAADDLDVQSEFAGLLHREREALAHRRDDENVGVLLLDDGELRPEVDVLAAVSFIRDDGSAVFLERLDEEFAKPLGIIAGNVVEDRRVLPLQRQRREVGDHLSLIGIEEADPEIVRTNFALLIDRYERVRGERADVGDAAPVEDGRRGDAESAAAGSDDRADLVLFDEAPGRVDHVFLPRAAVVHDEFDLLAEDSALCVDFGDRNLDRLDFRYAVRREVARHRRDFADLDRVAGECRNRHEEQKTQEDRALTHTAETTHTYYPPILILFLFPDSGYDASL